eukprot:COSAG02_NODE_1653_length_11488_cov_66.480815_11_plen_1303_part_00
MLISSSISDFYAPYTYATPLSRRRDKFKLVFDQLGLSDKEFYASSGLSSDGQVRFEDFLSWYNQQTKSKQRTVCAIMEDIELKPRLPSEEAKEEQAPRSDAQCGPTKTDSPVKLLARGRLDSMRSPRFTSSAAPRDEKAVVRERVFNIAHTGHERAAGGHGEVFRAVWKGSIDVAIKVQKTTENTAETRLFTDLRHPNVVACYGILDKTDTTTDRVKNCIVMEPCTVSLRTFLRNNDHWQNSRGEQLNLDEMDDCKYTILEHISQGLQKLHDMSVLHRDLKTQNILLKSESSNCEYGRPRGTWKICDVRTGTASHLPGRKSRFHHLTTCLRTQFGEAKILRTPVVSFDKMQQWRSDIDPGRFVRVTAESLQARGARWYCWLHPGETYATAKGDLSGCYSSVKGQEKLRRQLTDIGTPESWTRKSWRTSQLAARAIREGLTDEDFEGLEIMAGERAVKEAQEVKKELSHEQETGRRDSAAPSPDDIIEAVLRHHNPYPQGALIYSFSEDRRDRNVHDCVFAVAAPGGYDLGESKQRTAWREAHPFVESGTNIITALNMIPVVELNRMANLLEIGQQKYKPHIPHVEIDLKRKNYRITRPTDKDSLDYISLHLSALLSLYSETQPFRKLLLDVVSEAGKLTYTEERLPRDVAQLRHMCEEESSIEQSDIVAAEGKILGDVSDPHPINALVEPSALDWRRKRIPLRAQPLIELLLAVTGESGDGQHHPKQYTEEMLLGMDVDQLRHMCEEESSIEQSDLDAAQELCKPTHYVFAYQLDNWYAQDLTAKQLDRFDMYSGEIALASYGGLIYLHITGEGEKQEVQVVGVNALSRGPSPAYPGGAVERPSSDRNFSSEVASPELWAGSNIGLESDIFAFGIVMWEVFSRRRAWHWRGPGCIGDLVRSQHMRPKVPFGIQDKCAQMIRRCLHANAGKRPTAEVLAGWLRARREGLRKEVQLHQRVRVSERSTLNQDLYSLGGRRWSVTLRSHEASARWHYGKYSEHAIRTTSNLRGRTDDMWYDRSVELTITTPHTPTDWEETAMTDESPGESTADLSAPVRLHDAVAVAPARSSREAYAGEPQPLGVRWKRERNDDGDGDSLRVLALDDCICGATCTATEKESCRPSLMKEFPEVQVGYKLVNINGDTVPADGAVIKGIFRERPLRLTFTPPKSRKLVLPWATQAYHVDSERSELPPWIEEGLKCVQQVQRYEAKQKGAEDQLRIETANQKEELARAWNEVAVLKRKLAAAGVTTSTTTAAGVDTTHELLVATAAGTPRRVCVPGGSPQGAGMDGISEEHVPEPEPSL